MHIFLRTKKCVADLDPKGIRESHEAKKKYFDLGGNRTHDLRIRSTVTLPTELRGRTEIPFTRAI